MATDADSNPWDIRAGESAFAYLDRIQVLDVGRRPRAKAVPPPPGARRPEPFRVPRPPQARTAPAPPEQTQNIPQQIGPPGTVSRELLQWLLNERAGRQGNL